MFIGLVNKVVKGHILTHKISKASMTAPAAEAARKIFIGSDHGGFEMKKALTDYLKSKEVSVNDIGTHTKESCDYPDIAKELCKQVLSSKSQEDLGILVCGTGIRISIAARLCPWTTSLHSCL